MAVPDRAPPPLKRRHYFILLALAGGDRYGLGVAREVEALSEGSVRLWPATLYGSLDDLRETGWIEELDDPRRPPDESERKRFYRLTPAGRRVAAAETERLAALVKLARGRVKPRTGEAG